MQGDKQDLHEVAAAACDAAACGVQV